MSDGWHELDPGRLWHHAEYGHLERGWECWWWHVPRQFREVVGKTDAPFQTAAEAWQRIPELAGE